MSVAHSLIQINENTGFELYYDVLVGEKKGGCSLIAGQLNDLKTPERAIKFAFDQGIGFVPYGGYGMQAVHAWQKTRTSPTPLRAPRALAESPVPLPTRPLGQAASCHDWAGPHAART